MIEAKYYKRIFDFKKPSGTSRGILTRKKSWFIEIWDSDQPNVIGIGECSIIESLSPEYVDDSSYELMLDKVCKDITVNISDWPSIMFGVETALLDLENGGRRIYFDNGFYRGRIKIPINGLVWMGSQEEMEMQIQDKINAGFTTVKMKIGAINLNEELEILKNVRKRYPKNEIILRLDANGAFEPQNVNEVLQKLSEFGIHSIEQPIVQGNWQEMKSVCEQSPIPIALDEELIGAYSKEEKLSLLQTIQPHFIVLKPSLHGGISGTKEWIELAKKENIGWWITSALESNIGLNAICQLTAEYDVKIPQGLGTGSLYLNNIPSNLIVENGTIRYEI